MAENFWDRLKYAFSPNDVKLSHDQGPIQDEEHHHSIIQLEAEGGSGTEIHGGFFDEEFLAELQGTEASDTYDKMRRTDARIKMSLSAVKNPIKSAVWQVLPGDDSENAKLAAEFVEHNLFDDMDKTWSEFLHEALSLVDFGHSVFEKVHKVVLNHPRFGTYIGIRSLAFRSQRTIERWHMDKAGKLLSIDQLATGDVGDNVTIPGKFLLTYSLDKEGDNYIGISMLRPCLGPWKRKQLYLKLNAIGIEKFAVPTIIGTAPKTSAKDKQFANFTEVLKKYTTHQSNYIVVPEGWDIKAHNNVYDPAKCIEAIRFENNEIAVAFLANFLELGQSGSGSYALSFDLSDFFLKGIEHIAHLIADGLNQSVIPELIKLNFPNDMPMPKIAVSGISDKAGKELAEVAKMLVESKVIIPDNNFETHMRERFDFPEASEEGQRQVDPPAAPAITAADPKKKDDIQLASAKTPRGLITNISTDLKSLMKTNLKAMAAGLTNSVMRRARKNGLKLSATKGVTAKGVTRYKQAVITMLTFAGREALKQARKELPRDLKSVELAEDDIPTSQKKKIVSQANEIVDKQIADLEGATFLRYGSAIERTQDLDLVADQMKLSTDEFIEGASVAAGAGNAASFTVNNTRAALFFDDQIAPVIETFTFTNPDPKSQICKNLAGKVFRANDPSASAFFPPLHHNCKSYLVPHIVGTPGPATTPGGLRPTGTPIQIESALKSIKFTEHLDDDEEISEGAIANPSGAHIHLDAKGEKTGPAVSEGELHYHEKEKGGRVESAMGVKGHTHKDGNEGETGPDIPLEPDRQPDDVQLQQRVLQTIIISKGLHQSLDLAKMEAREFGIVEKVDDAGDSFRFRQRDPDDFVEGSFRTFKPKMGVSLVFGQLK